MLALTNDFEKLPESEAAAAFPSCIHNSNGLAASCDGEAIKGAHFHF
jgi:hypothetical protein